MTRKTKSCKVYTHSFTLNFSPFGSKAANTVALP